MNIDKNVLRILTIPQPTVLTLIFILYSTILTCQSIAVVNLLNRVILCFMFLLYINIKREECGNYNHNLSIFIFMSMDNNFPHFE